MRVSSRRYAHLQAVLQILVVPPLDALVAVWVPGGPGAFLDAANGIRLQCWLAVLEVFDLLAVFDGPALGVHQHLGA